MVFNNFDPLGDSAAMGLYLPPSSVLRAVNFDLDVGGLVIGVPGLLRFSSAVLGLTGDLDDVRVVRRRVSARRSGQEF